MWMNMESVLDWGVTLILWLQHRFSPELDLMFTIITCLGNEGFYLLLLPLIYWCVDRGQGARLAILLVNLYEFRFKSPGPSAKAFSV